MQTMVIEQQISYFKLEGLSTKPGLRDCEIKRIVEPENSNWWIVEGLMRFSELAPVYIAVSRGGVDLKRLGLGVLCYPSSLDEALGRNKR